jgi:hypothetical protein
LGNEKMPDFQANHFGGAIPGKLLAIHRKPVLCGIVSLALVKRMKNSISICGARHA